MAEPTPLDEANDGGRPQFATRAMIRDASPILIGGNACAIPAFVACECGRDLHITVHLSTAQIEAAVSRVLGDMRRKAMQYRAPGTATGF